MKEKHSRRQFLGILSASAAVSALQSEAHSYPTVLKADHGKPALLGGRPVRIGKFPSWPVAGKGDQEALADVLQSGKWNRGPKVESFEQAWAKKLDCPYCIATASGTAALCASLSALEVGPGDEVIVPPYTFAATINVVLMRYALPVFVDTDRSTFQIDAGKIETALTERTRCIIPVHLGGNCADMDAVMELGGRRGLPVLEDACQAHLAEWKGQKVGTIGDLGCFSFQASKNLNSGEGGAVVSRNGELAAHCASFQNVGRGYMVDENGRLVGDNSSGFAYARQGDNRRITEFQGALLSEQLSRLEEQSKVRESNARYLTEQLSGIAGIRPAREYPGCTRNAYHLYMFRYDPKEFRGLPRSRFLEALSAEGIPCSGGYSPLNREPYIRETVESRGFRRVFSEQEIRHWRERNHCPENDRLCEEAVWFGQTQLLGSRKDMDDIVSAIEKIRRSAEELKV